jgi:putative restriction endonuclease
MMMKKRPDSPVIDQFDGLNVWSRGDQRAPHKPLLVLYALGRWSRGDTADIPFRDVDRDLTGLLREFGPSRQSYRIPLTFCYSARLAILYQVRKPWPARSRDA